MPEAQALLRYSVFAAFAASVLLATASWLVRTRRVSPFGVLGRALRAASDPVVRPVERRLVRLGGNPVHAGWWLAVLVAAGGVALIVLVEWLVRTARLTFVALVLRVVASWFGFFRYARWMRPVYALTDWLVEPIRRLLPPMGALDWSPLAAWLALWILKQLLLSVVML